MTSFKKMEFDVEIQAPAHVFYDVLTNKPDCFSTMSPDTIQSSTLEVGKDGTVMSVDYNQDGKKKSVKDIIEKKDEKNLTTTWKIIDGDLLKEYKSFKVGMQATPKGTGSLVHWTFEYENNNTDSQDPHSLKEFACLNTKNIDAYLLNAQLNHA